MLARHQPHRVRGGAAHAADADVHGDLRRSRRPHPASLRRTHPGAPAGPWDWSGTVPGETSATLWTKTLTYDELPRVVDPPTGWLQNANDPPWTTSFPAVLDPNRFPPYVAPRHMGFRPQRSAGMLATTDKMTWDDLLRKGQDTHMELADRILDDLEAAVAAHGDADAKRAMALLNAWDRTADSASRGAVLFVDWYGKAAKHGELPFAVQWSEAKPRSTPDGLADPRAAAAALSAAAKEVEKTSRPSRCRLGRCLSAAPRRHRPAEQRRRRHLRRLPRHRLQRRQRRPPRSRRRQQLRRRRRVQDAAARAQPGRLRQLVAARVEAPHRPARALLPQGAKAGLADTPRSGSQPGAPRDLSVVPGAPGFPTSSTRRETARTACRRCSRAGATSPVCTCWCRPSPDDPRPCRPAS